MELTPETHIQNGFSTLRSRLRRLPPIHQTTFQAIIEHLHRIAINSGKNKMDAKNLAVVFSESHAFHLTTDSVVFGQDQATDVTALTLHMQKDSVLEDIINQPELVSIITDLLTTALRPCPSANSALGAGSAKLVHHRVLARKLPVYGTRRRVGASVR